MSDIPNFFEWCKKKNLDPFFEETPAEEVETDSKAPEGDVKSESGSAKRAAVRSHAYPPLYGRSQYPPEYFRPIAADAPVYQELDGIKGKDK